MEKNFQTIIIYPSWASFSFKWEDIERIIDKPDSWSLLGGVNYYTKMGYSVEPSDQSLMSGPGTGGLICVHRPFTRWFPAVLFRTEASFEPVPGFKKISLFPLHFVIGKITAEHKLRFRPYPKAPSPWFSLERIETRPEWLHIAIAATKEGSLGVLVDRIRFWNDDIIISSEAPDPCRHRFDALRRANSHYIWCTIPISQNDSLLTLGKYVHACSFADQNGDTIAANVHVFLSKKAGLEGEFSAAMWPLRSRRLKTSNDW